MRNIIIILLFSLSAKGQVLYTRNILTSGTGYAQANSILMAFGYYNPGLNPDGSKPGIVLFLHGIDHRGSRGDTIGTDGIDLVAMKGIPLMIKNTPFPYMQKPGTVGVMGLRRLAVIFPQCSKEYSTWPVAYGAEMIKYIKANLANVVDTNQIIGVGFSLGGGGMLGLAGDAFCSANMADFRVQAPGYFGSTNYQQMADGARMFFYHDLNDPLAAVSISDNFVTQINARNPIYPVQYYRFININPVGSDHDLWPMINDTIPGSTYLMTNGDYYTNRVMLKDALLSTKKRPLR